MAYPDLAGFLDHLHLLLVVAVLSDRGVVGEEVESILHRERSRGSQHAATQRSRQGSSFKIKVFHNKHNNSNNNTQNNHNNHNNLRSKKDASAKAAQAWDVIDAEKENAEIAVCRAKHSIRKLATGKQSAQEYLV